MGRSESQTHPGWAWGFFPRSWDLRGGQVGTPGSGRQASREQLASTRSQCTRSCGWWAGQPSRLSSSPGTSLWGWGSEGEEGPLSLFWDPQSSSKHPFTHGPMGPSSPLWAQESRVGVRVAWQCSFWLPILDPYKDTRLPGDNPDT